MKKKQTNKLHIESPPLPSTFFDRIHLNVLNLNNSKFFAGVVMIMLNVGSKFIPIQFSKSAEEYLKKSLSKVMIVFAMSWMGTRDIYTAIALTTIFVICSDYLFNEESLFCIVPHHKRILESLDQKEDTASKSATTDNNNSSESVSGSNMSTKEDKEDLSKEALQLIQNTRKKIEANYK
jgi:hypothetical protein